MSGGVPDRKTVSEPTIEHRLASAISPTGAETAAREPDVRLSQAKFAASLGLPTRPLGARQAVQARFQRY